MNAVWDYNCFHNSGTVPSLGVNNITADQLFVNPSNGNYNLQAGSPCINTGHPTLIYSDIDRTSEQVEVNPFNAPPDSFVLQFPADRDTLSTVTQPIEFIWNNSSDIDEDTLFYKLSISGPNIDTTITNLSDAVYSFSGFGLFVKNSIYT